MSFKSSEDDVKKDNKQKEKREMTREEEVRQIKKTIIDYAVTIAIVVGIGLFLLFFIIVNAEIPTGSMENTIMEGDRIFGFRLSYKFADPERYDIVIFKYPDDEKQLFIKRIIGLPGETVIITDGEVYVVDSSTVTDDISDEEFYNDPMILPGTICLDDDFLPEEMNKDFKGVYRVPEESYFVLGDNRNHSRDSRYWNNKYVAADKILGKAILRYWPLTKISLLN